MPGWYFAHAQVDLYLRILPTFEGTFSFDAAHVIRNIWREHLNKFLAGPLRKHAYLNI